MKNKSTFAPRPLPFHIPESDTDMSSDNVGAELPNVQRYGLDKIWQANFIQDLLHNRTAGNN